MFCKASGKIAILYAVMAKLTREDVLKLARLARLDLSATEVELFRRELSDILGYVEKLQSVQVGDRHPTYQVSGLSSVTRPDEVINYGIDKKALLKNVPQVEAGQIKVKRVL